VNLALLSQRIRSVTGYFLYAEQLNARMLGGVALVVAGTLLLRLP
jgi:multidrug transporter EmrE-like cation transporter